MPADNAGNSKLTAYASSEEGGDDVKSSWPLRPGQHTCYNGDYNALQDREVERIAKKSSQFRSESATRLREVGIASNRRMIGHAGQHTPVNTFPGLVHTARQAMKARGTPHDRSCEPPDKRLR